MRVSLRKPVTEKKYQEHIQNLPIGYCPFCDDDREVKKNYKYWKMVANKFPYDDAYSVHDLLVCKRHIAYETELTVAEAEELQKIKRQILEDNEYNQIVENSKPRRSVPPHYHIHCCLF